MYCLCLFFIIFVCVYVCERGRVSLFIDSPFACGYRMTNKTRIALNRRHWDVGVFGQGLQELDGKIGGILRRKVIRRKGKSRKGILDGLGNSLSR